MKETKPTSFKVFIAVISITVLVFTTATLFSIFHVDKKYSMILAFFMFIAFALTAVGIYAGFNHKTEEKRAKTQNRTGLIGNMIIFLFTIGLMAFAALTKAS
jgi:hypothetical protein